MKKYIYLLYRTEYSSLFKELRYHYFNSSFVEHKIIIKQLFANFRWYESIEPCLFEKAKKEELKWAIIIYFNKYTIYIARIFALFVLGHWYKIYKLEVV